MLAFAGDSTWHWWMEGFEAQHKRFWRQVVLWLAQGRNGRRQRLGAARPAPLRARRPCRIHARRIARPTGEEIADALFAAGDAARRHPAPARVVRQVPRRKARSSTPTSRGDYPIQVIANTKDGQGTRQGASPASSSTNRIWSWITPLPIAARWSSSLRSRAAAAVAPELLPQLLDESRKPPDKFEIRDEIANPAGTPGPSSALRRPAGQRVVPRKRWGLV